MHVFIRSRIPPCRCTADSVYRFALVPLCPLDIELVSFRNFVYVSTAFSHATDERVGGPVLEQFYPCPVPPELVIGMVESLDEHRLEYFTEQ